MEVGWVLVATSSGLQAIFVLDLDQVPVPVLTVMAITNHDYAGRIPEVEDFQCP